MIFWIIKRCDIELIFKLVNIKESLQEVNAAKIVIKSRLYFILIPVKKRAHYIVESSAKIRIREVYIDKICWMEA